MKLLGSNKVQSLINFCIKAAPPTFTAVVHFLSKICEQVYEMFFGPSNLSHLVSMIFPHYKKSGIRTQMTLMKVYIFWQPTCMLDTG